MNILHLVKVRFDRRTVAITQEWLDHRYEFFGRYTLPSLLAQVRPGNQGPYKDWALWINCDAGMREMVDKLKRLLDRRGIYPLWSFGDDTPLDELLGSLAFNPMLKSADYVYVTRLDSDDLYTNDALHLVSSLSPREGGEVEASIFRRGYMHELPGVSDPASYPDGRLGVYYNPSSPFHTIMYPREVFIDPARYMQVWEKIGDHSRVESALYSHPLPHFKFCVLVHGSNFLSTFDYGREEGIAGWVEKRWEMQRFIKQPVVFDVDDFADEWGGVKGETVLEQLDTLKARYPGFRCTLFTIPEATSKPLLARAKSRRWIELGVHGLCHAPNLELEVVSPFKLLSYVRSLDYSVYSKVFRPPGWYIDKAHIDVLSGFGMPVCLNYKDAPTLARLCQSGYYVCGERTPYWHGHTHNVCGNWLKQHLASLLTRWHPLQEFSFVSDAVIVPA